MAIYIIDVFISGFLSMFVIREFDEKGIETQQSKRRKIICLGLILLTWVLIYALRGTTGTDAGGYRTSYLSMYNNNIPLSQLLEKYRDKLYQILIYYCAALSKGSWVFGCFTMGIITYFPILYFMSKKSEDINLSILLFIMTLEAFFGFNGIRQGLSIGIVYCAYYFGLRNKKYFRYILLMLIAFGFHAGVVFVIPFHLISLKKLKAVSSYFLLIVAFMLTFFLKNIWNDVLNLMAGDQVVSKYTNMFQNNVGSSIIRVLVWLAPVAVALFCYSRLKERYTDVDHDILMVIFGAVFMTYSMLSPHFSQMAVYFSCSSLVLYPKIVNCINVEDKRVIKYPIIILFFVYMIALLLNGEMGIIPYKPVWDTGMY